MAIAVLPTISILNPMSFNHPQYHNVGNPYQQQQQQQIRAQQSSNQEIELLPPEFRPGEWDVICQRGKECYEHEGNKRFRIVIEQNLPRYQKAGSRQRKSVIVNEVVEAVRKASSAVSLGGGFIRKDLLTRRWYRVDDKIAREKCGQALRDMIKVQRAAAAAGGTVSPSQQKKAPPSGKKRGSSSDLMATSKETPMQGTSVASDDEESSIGSMKRQRQALLLGAQSVIHSKSTERMETSHHHDYFSMQQQLSAPAAHPQQLPFLPHLASGPIFPDSNSNSNIHMGSASVLANQIFGTTDGGGIPNPAGTTSFSLASSFQNPFAAELEPTPLADPSLSNMGAAVAGASMMLAQQQQQQQFQQSSSLPREESALDLLRHFLPSTTNSSSSSEASAARKVHSGTSTHDNTALPLTMSEPVLWSSSSVAARAMNTGASPHHRARPVESTTTTRHPWSHHQQVLLPTVIGTEAFAPRPSPSTTDPPAHAAASLFRHSHSAPAIANKTSSSDEERVLGTTTASGSEASSSPEMSQQRKGGPSSSHNYRWEEI